MGDLTAAECRAEAGPDCGLSGGVSPDLWYSYVPEEDFITAVKDWLALKHASPRLLAAAGDQVPPGAEERRITLMRGPGGRIRPIRIETQSCEGTKTQRDNNPSCLRGFVASCLRSQA